MSFRVAEGFVEVSMDRKKYDADLQKLKGQKLDLQILAKLEDSAARAQLKELGKAFTVHAKAVLDDEQVKAQLKELSDRLTVKIAPELGETGTYAAELERLTKDKKVVITPVMGNPADYLRVLDRLTRDQFVTVNPRIRADAYLTQLDRLTRDRHIDVRTNLITGDTRARLDTLTRNRRVRIDVDSGGLTSLIASMARLSGAAGGASGGVESLVSGMGLLIGAAATSLPTLASLGQAIIAMAPAAAVAVPAIGALGAAFGAIKLGTSGLGAAFKQAFEPAVSGGGAAVDKARQVADAQQALKLAVRDAADSNRRAVEQVAAAERDLTTAQRQEKQAQQDLTKARADAEQQLADLNAQLANSELDHRQALLDVQKAKQDLDNTLRDRRATQLDRDQAQLTYDQAQQHLADQTEQQKRLQQQAAAARAADVDGSEQVKAALQGVADAQQDVADKQQALSETRISADRTAEDSALRVAQAQRAVGDAMKSQAAGAAALENAMAKLAPAAREFANAVIALKPAWDSLKLDVQQALFTGLGEKLTSVAHQVLPDLRDGLVGTAGVLNGMGKSFLDSIDNLSKTGTLKQAFASINDGLKPLTAVPGQLATMFGQLTVAAGPAFQKITTAIGETVGVWGKKLGDAFADGRLTEVINGALTLAAQFGRLLGDVLGTFGNVMKAAASAGGDALGMLGVVFGELRRVTAGPEVQGALKALFETLNKIGAVLGPLIGQALMALGPVIQALAPGVQTLVAALGSGLQQAIAGLAPLLLSAGQAISQLLIAASPLLPLAGQLIGQLGIALTPVLNVLAACFQRFAPLVKIAGDVLSGVLTPVLAILPTVLQPFLDQLVGLVSLYLPVLQDMITQLQPALTEVAQVFADVAVALAPVIAQLVDLQLKILSKLLPALEPLITFVAELARIFANELAFAVQTIVIPALNTLSLLLQGDYAGAFRSFKDTVKGIMNEVLHLFIELPPKILDALSELDQSLYKVGRNIMQSLINGIASQIVNLRNQLSDITNLIPKWKGPAERDAQLLSPNGELLIQGLMSGIDRQVPRLRAQLMGLTSDIGNTQFGIGGGTIAPLGVGSIVPTATTAVAVQTAAPARASVTIQNLTINGSFDFSSEADRRAAANALVVEIKDALRDYDRGRAR